MENIAFTVDDSIDLNNNNNESASALPKVAIAWKNLTFEVKSFTGLSLTRKTILNRLCGHFNVGTLNSLLGPSGAGKTTLLNCLSGNERGGLCEDSQIYINNSASAISYFVAQHVHENIIGQLTVGQILSYAFQFKNGSGYSNNVMGQFIKHVLGNLLLDETILGRTFSVCSGGEQKRIAIAQELMSLKPPTFLFIDEPTTGLDSCAAFEVMQCLQKLAKSQQMTIIASIHSPNQETLHLFDDLYVLAKGGSCIYAGFPAKIREHIEVQLQLKIPSEQPPVEALLKIACKGLQDHQVQHLAAKCTTNESTTQSLLPPTPLRSTGFLPAHAPFSFFALFFQISRLFRIIFLCNWKLFTFNIVQYLTIYILFYTLYNHEMAIPTSCYPLDTNGSSTNGVTCARDLHESRLVDENNTFHGYTLLLIGFLIMCTSAIVYAPLVKAFTRSEHRNHWYSLGVFTTSVNLVSFIEVSFYSMLISTLAYFLSFQHAADGYQLNWNRFSFYIFFIWLLCIYTQSIGHLIGAILMNYTEVAIIVCQVIYVLMAVMNGYFVDTEKTGNVAFIQLANIIAVKYITKGLMYTFYGLDRCDWEMEFSSIMIKYHVDEHRLQEYVLRVVVNIVVVRVITWCFLYFKLNGSDGGGQWTLVKWLRKLMPKGNRKKQLNVINEQLKPYSIESQKFGETNSNCLEDWKAMDQHAKSVDELAFKQFTANKIIIGWRSLSLFGSSSIYEIGVKRSQKVQPKLILRSLNGQFCFGSLNGLMGTSGAGKTSLLKVLNGRCKTRLSEETSIYLSKYTAIHSCFITQEVSGHLMPGLTAHQTLYYASRLKNTQADVDHEAIARRWLQELDLLNTANTKVEHCSGGERKRLAVALELTSLVMPNLICIDEPTSGLDTNSAQIVISTLRQLTTAHPLTIITSIHQPTTEVLYMFDQLYVLARGGVCIYSGPPNAIQAHLTSAHPPSAKSRHTPLYPIEELIKYSCSDYSHPAITAFTAHTSSQILQTDKLLTESTQLAPDGVLQNRPRFSLHSVAILSQRYFAYISGYLWRHLVAFIIITLIYGYQLTIFFDGGIAAASGCIDIESDFNNTCHRSIEAILEEYQVTENYKYNYFMLVVFLFLLMLQSSLIFGKEYVYLLNEHRNGWYSSGSFYLMKSLYELLPLPLLIMGYIYITNIYSTVLPHIYWQLVRLLILSALGFQGMAHLFSLLSSGNITLLTIISISVFIFYCTISNFFIPLHQLPAIYQFIANFSISRYLFECSLLLQYGFGRCPPGHLQTVLYSMEISDEDYYSSIGMLLINLVIYRLLAIGLLISKATPLQNRRQRVARIERYHSELVSGSKMVPRIQFL